MKPKTTAHSRSDRLRRAVQPASALFKKKEPKRLSTNKKTVRFNLSTKLSTSELVLYDNKAVNSLKSNVQRGQELTSRSSVNIAASRIALKPIYKRPLSCMLDRAQLWNQLTFRNMTSVRKCFGSFTDLYMWGPVFNLHKNVPVRGILKNTGCSDQFNNSCGSYSSHENILLAEDSLHDVSERTNKQNCQASFAGECSMFDNLASSIQGLHISAYACQAPREVNVSSGHQRYHCPQIQSFPVYLSQSHLPAAGCHGVVGFLGTDTGSRVHQYDLNQNVRSHPY